MSDDLERLSQYGFPDGTDVGGGTAADGSPWRLIMHKVHREAPYDEDLHFWLIFRDGGSGWNANTATPPTPLQVTNNSTHGRAHTLCGLVTHAVARVVGHNNEGNTRDATIVRLQFLPLDVFVASGEYPRWVASVEAYDANGSALGRTPEWAPSEHVCAAWAKDAERGA